MNDATTVSVDTPAGPLTDVTIAEVGKHRLPLSILRPPIEQGVLEVAAISFAPTNGDVVLESIDGVVTTVPLCEGVRLHILPKVSFRALGHLLKWATHRSTPATTIAVPFSAHEDRTWLPMLVENYLATLPTIVQNGWLFEYVPRQCSHPVLSGVLDAAGTIDELYERNEVVFRQLRYDMSWSHEANRVLRTTLEVLHGARRSLTCDHARLVCDYLCRMPPCDAYASRHLAAGVCRRLIETPPSDCHNRSYYTSAFGAALPILEAVSRHYDEYATQKDVPLRIRMPSVFESAMRNVIRGRLTPSFVVNKGRGVRLYESATRDAFNPGLEPDVVITRNGVRSEVVAAIDIKYKDAPTASDHQQLAAYLLRYNAPSGGFVTVGDPRKGFGVVAEAKHEDGRYVFEFAVDCEHIEESVTELLEFVAGRVCGQPADSSWRGHQGES